MALDITPGDRIRRTELHARHGGRRQGGISPSRVSANVFVITAPDRGSDFGYLYDGRGEDGFFHYTGEGQIGDQQMTQGNRAIRDHEREGRELHLFQADRTMLEYIGQFRYHDDYQADAPDISGERDRKVIVFRLEQLAGTSRGPTRTRLDRLSREPVTTIPIEQLLTERMLIDGDREPYEAERREQRLVWVAASRLEQLGHEISRLQFWPKGEAAPLFADLYDKATNTIYEAKANVTRPAIRMAIGQLADYARLLIPNPNRAILLPEQPRPDLLELLRSQDIEVVWPLDDGALSNEEPQT